MQSRITRRALLAAAICIPGCSGFPAAPSSGFLERLTAIRSRIGGRIGVHALDTHSGRRLRFDDDSRYAMASTFKLLLAAAILAGVDRGALSLDRRVPLTERDLVPYAPVTSKHTQRGWITVRELCAAIIEVSDNPAANLLLGFIGGPEGLTRFARTLGDRMTRLDRYEVELNSNLPDDPRDTTSAGAMAASVERVLVGDVLTEDSRALLIDWLVNATTGLKRLRAGLPQHWRVGDKTGSGANGALNDVAIAWPRGRRPVIMAVFMSGSTQSADALNAAHAEIAGEIVRELAL